MKKFNKSYKQIFTRYVEQFWLPKLSRDLFVVNALIYIKV